MTWFNAYIEADHEISELTDENIDALVDALIDYSPAVTTSPTHTVAARLSLQAATIRQAGDIAHLALTDALDKIGITDTAITVLELMTEEEFLRREGAEDLPDVVGTHDAAEILSVSPQRVVQLSRRLGARKVGKTLVFPRSRVVKAAKVSRGVKGADAWKIIRANR